jgi:outer membrane protein OmpA-like peptidoglycan-associated protein
VEFYVSRAERSIGSVKEFGVLFGNRIRFAMPGTGISIEPNIDLVKKSGYRNKRKWIKLSAAYTADGTETALSLGYFNHNSKKFRGYAHYYVDDVSVTLVQNDEDLMNDETPVPAVFIAQPGETITLHNIFFATNKSELLPASFPELDKLVQYLNETSNVSIEISGHTDKSGDEKQNQILSELRAKAVADYLMLKGIAQSRINYTGYGSSKPIATNDTDVGKEKNRRVEFKIIKN